MAGVVGMFELLQDVLAGKAQAFNFAQPDGFPRSDRSTARPRLFGSVGLLSLH